jgi:uncharacterized membrane protein YecN with MAPEG domain
MISAFYAALLALVQVGLTLNVVRYRRSQHVSLGTEGGDATLLKAVRAHGNFIEVVPLALLMIVLAELQGAPGWILHSLAMLLVIGRVLHIYAILFGPHKKGQPRVVGMVLSLFVLILGALINLWFAFPAL